jgi:hypothetical protein
MRQQAHHVVELVAQRLITADEVAIAVGERGRGSVETPGAAQIEKHRATPEKRLNVAVEVGGIVLAERGQELPLAARPLQKRTCRGREPLAACLAQ